MQLRPTPRSALEVAKDGTISLSELSCSVTRVSSYERLMFSFEVRACSWGRLVWLANLIGLRVSFPTYNFDCILVLIWFGFFGYCWASGLGSWLSLRARGRTGWRCMGVS
jgi:hypothetical protein